MIGVGLAFAIVLGLGLQFDRILRSYPDGMVAGAAVLGIVLISFPVTMAVSYLHFKWMGDKVPAAWNPKPLVDFNAWDEDRSRPSGTISDERAAHILRVQEAITTAKRLRVAALTSDADPARRKYAALVERGEQWNDDQIAYRENGNLTGTCVHLREVEQAIRQTGIETRLMAAFRMPNLVTLPRISADCRLDEAALRRQFAALSPSIQYRDGFQPEKAPNDNPWASLTCGDCSSSIELVHPSDGSRNARWFPSAS